ncbi:hypothetical protein J4Q44_G00021950 [Coregonus suidteri]|uniref:Ig-like domain-containing protein n=1 Tax=Coregonus suidteri TaxID=861788 RepID=A0AAN8M7R7_9TELE
MWDEKTIVISQLLSTSLLFSVIIEVQFLISPMGVAAPGSDITLSCYFPPSKNLNLNHLYVNWQQGESEPPSWSPQLSVQSSCDSFIITLNSSQGFPQPNVLWTDSIGGDISNQSHSHIGLDSRGRYEVHSSMEVRPNGTLTIITEMRLDVLNQSFTRSLTLHPLPECCEVPLATRGRPALGLLGIVLLAALAMSLILYYRHKPETHQHQMVPRDDTTGQDEAHETET